MSPDEAAWIRSNHPYAFRSGEWARVLMVAPSEERDCYVVELGRYLKERER